MSPQPSSVALIPYYGPGAHRHYEALRKAQLRVATTEWIASIDVARSMLVEMALARTNAEVLVFIDSDIEFVREDYDRLVESAHQTGGIVGGAYLTRARLDGGQHLVGNPIATGPLKLEFFEHGRLYPATYLGMGFTAIARPVIERMALFHGLEKCEFMLGNLESHGYPLFQPLIHEGRYLLEDYAFCHRAKEAGIPIHLDTRPVLVHHGMHGYRMSDLGLRSGHTPDFEMRAGGITRLPPSSTDGHLGLEKP
jgi:hypothetical protein